MVDADAVVAATGAWTNWFLEPAGVAVAVTPERGQIAHISLEPADTSRWPVVLPGETGHYLLAFDGSRVVAGGARESGGGFGPPAPPARLPGTPRGRRPGAAGASGAGPPGDRDASPPGAAASRPRCHGGTA